MSVLNTNYIGNVANTTIGAKSVAVPKPTVKSPVAIQDDVVVKPVAQSAPLALFELGLLAFFVIVIGSLIALNLNLTYKGAHLQNAAEAYRVQTAELQNQTNLLLSEWIEQFDYSIIKQIAEQNGMQLQRGNVRNVTE